MTVLDWHHRFDFGGPRPASQVRNIFIHTTENAPNSLARSVAEYQLRTRSGSYHELIDRTTVLIANTVDWTTWSTGNKGNDVGWHLAVVARASMTRAEWMHEETAHRTLTRAAERVALVCAARGIPPVYVGPDDLAAGRPGISTHAAARVWGGTDHWDPGTGFPMELFCEIVAKKMKEKPDMTSGFTASDREKLERVYHELTHRFDSRADIAAGKSPVFRDTAIGYALEIDRKLELAPGSKLGAVFADILARLDAIEGKL